MYKTKITRSFLFILVLILANSCAKDQEDPINNDPDKVFLLTNYSSKVWFLSKIVTQDFTIVPYPCIADDEMKYFINGTCTIDNMGTVAAETDFSAPIFCTDTLSKIDIYTWEFNQNMDTLIMIKEGLELIGRVVKLTNDTMILARLYNDSFLQTEYYVSNDN